MGLHQNIFSNQYPITNGIDRGICYYDGTTTVPQIKTSQTLLLNSDGTITDTTRANFKAYYSANSPINIAAGNDYILVPNVKVFDDANNFNTGTGTFTANVAGKYKFHMGVRAISLSIAALTNARVQSYALSSTEVGIAEDRLFSALISLNSSYFSVGDTTIMNLALNQTVQFHVILSGILGFYGIGGGTLTSLTTTTISGWRI